MDTSETYIKMCEKAEEIQEGWNPACGDFVCRPSSFLGDKIVGKTSDSIVITKIGDCEADHNFGDKVAVYYSRNPIGEWDKLEDVFYKGHHHQFFFYWHDRKDYTWLPRQDQLQEMVPSPMASTAPNFRMISELNHFYDYWDTNGIPNFLNSWEQLWLAFVMKEKYNKIWDGENWRE